MPERKGRRALAKTDVFINCPFDRRFEPLFVAYIAGLAGLGFTPRCVLEIPAGAANRLDRLFELVRSCGTSMHDLSRVQIDRVGRVPRFNMPFELGLATAISLTERQHRWFVFEEQNYRLQRSLSDVNGFDPYIHDGRPGDVLRELPNALRPRGRRAPTAEELFEVYQALRRAIPALRREHQTPTLFAARPFAGLVYTAQSIAEGMGLFARSAPTAPLRPRTRVKAGPRRDAPKRQGPKLLVPLSMGWLTERLRGKGYPEDEIRSYRDRAIGDLQRSGIVDEAEADAFFENKDRLRVLDDYYRRYLKRRKSARPGIPLVDVHGLTYWGPQLHLANESQLPIVLANLKNWLVELREQGFR